MSVSPTRPDTQSVESSFESSSKLANTELKAFMEKTHGVINDETFRDFAEKFSLATKLKLPGSKLSSSALTALTKLANLTSIVFSSDGEVKTLEEGPLCKFFEDHSHLKTVDLTGIGGLTRGALLALCNSCKEIQDLEINAEELSAEDLKILSNLEKLDTLTLKNAENLGDEGIASVLESKKFVNLTLSGCRASSALFDRLEVQEQMRVFSMDGVDFLTESDCDSIKRLFPNLNFLFLVGCRDEMREKIQSKFADYQGSVEL